MATNNSSRALVLLAALSAACSSLERAPGSSVSVEASDAPGSAVAIPASATTADAGEAVEADAPAERTASAPGGDDVARTARAPSTGRGPATAPGGGLSPEDLSIWNDPRFRKRFVESYAAETDIEPTVSELDRDDVQEVLDLMSSDEVDKAAKLLEKDQGESSSAVFDFLLANIEFQRDELDEAAQNYSRAVAKYPRFRRAWSNLGLILARRGDFAGAVPALTRVIELGGADARTYGLLGFSYENRKNDLAAESAYRMACLLDPDTLDWKLGLARSLFGQERFAEVVSLCDGLITGDPDRSELWLLQANANIGLGKPLEAAKDLEIVDQLGKGTTESLYMLGDIYVNAELFDLAVGAYTRALASDTSGSAERVLRAAKALTARSALDETATLVAAVESTLGDRLDDGQEKDLLKLKARLAVARGDGDEEEASVLKQIVELDPLDGEALLLLGQHHERAGEPEKAILYYERAEALEGFEADAKVRHAQLLVNQRKYAEALPLLRRAQDLKPRDNVEEYLEQVQRAAQQAR